MQSPQTPSVMFKLFIWKRWAAVQFMHIACSQPVKWNRNGDSRIIDQNSKWGGRDTGLDCLSNWSEGNKTKRNQLFIYWYAWYLTPKLCADKNWIRGSVSNIILFQSKFTCFSFSLCTRDELNRAEPRIESEEKKESSSFKVINHLANVHRSKTFTFPGNWLSSSQANQPQPRPKH